MCSNRGVVYGGDMLLDVWDFTAQEVWGVTCFTTFTIYLCFLRESFGLLIFITSLDSQCPRLRCSFRTCPNLFVLCFGLSSRLKDSQGITCLERDVYRLYDCVMPYHLRQLLQLTDALPMNPHLFKFSFEFLPCSSAGVEFSQWVTQLFGL